MVNKVFWRKLTVAVALAVLASGARAQERGTNANGWHWQVTPYVWATGLGGDIRPRHGAPTVEIAKSFSDILEDLDAAMFVTGLARKGDLVVLGDLSWSSSSRAGGLPSPPAPAPLPAEGRVRQTSLTLAAGYRLSDGPLARWDILAGARHWRIDGRLSAPTVPGLFPGARLSGSHDFTDPIIAARGNLTLGPDWSAIVYGDLGGFGLGSERSAQLLGTVNYRARDGLYLSVGYRHLMVDYRKDGARFDLQLGGPLLGMTLKF